MSAILEAVGLRKTFTLHTLGGKVIHGCEDVHFALRKGEFLGIHGPSGAGKSTILKCIYRTYRPTGGRLLYDSETFGPLDLVQASERQVIELRRREMSYVSQFLQVIPRVSAQEVVAETLVRNGEARAEALDQARRMLGLLNLPEELWEASPATFSGGERQRVNIARAIIARPRLLLLDEPTASLDAGMQNVVLAALLALKAEGTTMVGIFHDLDLMRKIADSTLCVADGQADAVA